MGCQSCAKSLPRQASNSNRGRACLQCSPFQSLAILRVERYGCGKCRLVPCYPFAAGRLQRGGCGCSCAKWPKPEEPKCCREQVEVKTICKCKKCKCTKKRHCGCKKEHDHDDHDDDEHDDDDEENGGDHHADGSGSSDGSEDDS